MKWLSIVIFLLGMVYAAPRVGQYDGYTRLALDLPKSTSYSVLYSSSSITVSFNGVVLGSEAGILDSSEVAEYSLNSKNNTSTWVVKTKSAYRYKAFIIPDQLGNVRFVLDVGSNIEGGITGNSSGGVTASTPASGAGNIAKPIPPAPTPSGTKKTYRVVLDAGHGGVDPGASGVLPEKTITLDIALRTKRILSDKGVNVIMTRSIDKHLSSDKRSDLGMRAGMANAGTVNAFISIHVNSATNKSAEGIETYFFGKPLESRSRSLVIKENGGGEIGEKLTAQARDMVQDFVADIVAKSNLQLSRSLAYTLQSSMVAKTGAVNRGVHTDLFYVIRFARTPAVLVEVGFNSHPTEGKKLTTAEYRETLAQALAKGILQFLNIP